MIISGKELSAQVKENVKEKIAAVKEEGGRIPCLCVIRVGEDPASVSYVKSKSNACAAVGMDNRTIVLPEDASFEELEAVIAKANGDENVDGILVQLPLPKHLDEKKAIAAIAPDKDVDGLHMDNAGALFAGQPGFVPCTPKGIMYMLKSLPGVELDGANAVVLGRSALVGKPVAQLLLNENATVTTIHSHTKNPADITSQADIVIAAVGVPKLVKEDWIKPGAVIIDVGINRVDGKLVGDVDFEACKDKAAAISPVPGGVGLMTVAMLIDNTWQAYLEHEKGKRK